MTVGRVIAHRRRPPAAVRARLHRGLLASALAAFAALAGQLPAATPAQAQNPQPTSEVIRDWTLRCAQPEGAPAEQCILIQDIMDPSTQQPMMQVAAGFWGPERSRGLVVTLPLGVTLPPGVELKIDGQATSRTPFVTCTPNGCQSHVLLEEELLGQMKSGNRGTVVFTDQRGRPTPVDFSLSGFTAGFARVK